MPGCTFSVNEPEMPGTTFSRSPRMMPPVLSSSSSVTAELPALATAKVTGPVGTVTEVGEQPSSLSVT